MKNTILKIDNITKQYKHIKALNNVSFSLEKGNIYGFVGKNGAGKTTLMRLVAGLDLPDNGYIALFGKTKEKDLVKQRRRMGCLIETPILYNHMNAYQNMEIVRKSRGIPNKEKINEYLTLVGLEVNDKRKVKNYSTGLKQRLGIAMALISEPAFIMLDEPTNGLDPVSIVQIREVLIKLVEEKQVTVLVSSHILTEMYQLANHYIFINNGEIIETLSKEKLDEKCQRYIHLQVDDISKLTVILENQLNTKNYKILPDYSVALYDFIDDMDKVIQVMMKHDIKVNKISLDGDNLEDYFIKMVGGI